MIKYPKKSELIGLIFIIYIIGVIFSYLFGVLNFDRIVLISIFVIPLFGIASHFFQRIEKNDD